MSRPAFVAVLVFAALTSAAPVTNRATPSLRLLWTFDAGG